MPSDWERVGADASLLAALRRSYAGSGDPLDQLWWAEHPGERTPAGVPDPADTVEAARRSLFRRDAADTTAEDVERAAAAVSADRDAARAALLLADEQEKPTAARAAAPVRRARGVLVGAVVVALLVGGAAGFLAGRFPSAAEPPALAVFHRTQHADDELPSTATAPTGVLPASTRFLANSTTTGTVVYAAERSDGQVCMLAVVLASDVIASCASVAGFADSGLSLTFTATADAVSDTGIVLFQELHPRWSPTGRVTF
ncbi:MAG: hypothetical protein HIU86_08530 [Acidobacteria bacterium]|nr:hypothetical protein [Acidobacteriota bacterium]